MKLKTAAEKALEVDEVDRGIIEILRSNGRATNQEIADKLSLSAATVSARIRRLEESKAMRVVAVADFSAHGYNILIAVGVKVFGRSAADVGRDLTDHVAKIPGVFELSPAIAADIVKFEFNVAPL